MKKILVIDDVPQITDNVGEYLALYNYEVFTAHDGKLGVSLALSEVPDLVICDIIMPRLDGYAVLDYLRKNPLTRHIPFIFLLPRPAAATYVKESGWGQMITLQNLFQPESCLMQ